MGGRDTNATACGPSKVFAFPRLQSAFEKSPVVVLPSVVDPVDGLSSSAGEARMTRVSVGDPSDVQSALDGLRDRHRLLLVDLPETSGGDRALALQRAGSFSLLSWAPRVRLGGCL